MITKLFPSWSRNLGLMAAHGVHVRSRCKSCGDERGVDLKSIVQGLGSHANLIDRSEPCLVSDCDGEASYIASLPFRGHWIALTSAADLVRDAARSNSGRRNMCVVAQDEASCSLSFADEA